MVIPRGTAIQINNKVIVGYEVSLGIKLLLIDVDDKDFIIKATNLIVAFKYN